MNADELTVEVENIKKVQTSFDSRLTGLEKKQDDASERISKVGEQVTDLADKVSNLEKKQDRMTTVLDKIDKRTQRIEGKNKRTKAAIIISLVCAVGAFVWMACQSAEAAAAVAGIAAKLLII